MMAGESHVQFESSVDIDDSEKRQRYLTAKYGPHQMQLIRKRISAENWLMENLEKLFESSDKSVDYCKEQEDLLDELLDLDKENERRELLLKRLKGTTQPDEVLNKFIEELLAKAKTL